MSTELSNLLSAEAQQLSKPMAKQINYAELREQTLAAYDVSFDPYKDQSGQVVWLLYVGSATPKPIQKWFKAGPSLPAAVEKASQLRTKFGVDQLGYTLALECRDAVLTKLGGAR